MQKKQTQKIAIWLGLLLALTTSIAAQTPLPPNTTKREHNGQGYGFVAPVALNGESTGLQIGVGGEGLIHKGLGVGAELSLLTTPRQFREGIGLLSPNVSYHFLNATKDGKLVPFVTGGYTLFFRSGVAHGINFGGGVNYWFKERVGLRFEVRDQVLAYDDTAHYVGFRAGISFR
jgi:hypothetical protein